jgi:hypothetical protein
LLSDWMDQHARVAWFVHQAPWAIEGDVVRGLNLPLNREHNVAHPFFPNLGSVRASARALARQNS